MNVKLFKLKSDNLFQDPLASKSWGLKIEVAQAWENKIINSTTDQESADFKDVVKTSNSFKPSSGDFASPNILTIALPTMTPSAPHSATCNTSLMQIS